MTEEQERFNYIKLLIEENELSMQSELSIIDLLFKKYDFKTLKDYANDNSLTEQGILKRVAKETQSYIELCNQKFYF